MQEFSQVFQDLLWRFFQFFLLHLFLDLLHCFGCIMVLHGSPIFGVCFCDTGMGVVHDDMAIKFGLGFFLLFYWTEARVSTQSFVHSCFLVVSK